MSNRDGLSDNELEELFLTHLEIKQHLKKIIQREEHADEESVRADDRCSLGNWIYGKGQKYSGLPQYQRLKVAHATFHQQAYKALKLYNEGHYAEALAYIETGPFEESSLEIKNAFYAMRHEEYARS